MGKTLKWLLLLCLLILLPRSAAQADAWAAEPSPPLLPGAEEIKLLLESGAVCTRANVFSQGESIAREAVFENDCLTLRLFRPLRAGEEVRVLLEGKSADGAALFFDHVWRISRYDALLEEASLLKARLGGLTAADEQALEAFMRALLSPCAQIAPIVQFDPEKLSVLLDDASDQWQVTLQEDGISYGCVFLPEENLHVYMNVNADIRPKYAETILVFSSIPYGSRYLTAEFQYSAQLPFSLLSASLLLNRVGTEPGFFWKAIFQQDTVQCVFSVSDVASLFEREWTERMNLP